MGMWSRRYNTNQQAEKQVTESLRDYFAKHAFPQLKYRAITVEASDIQENYTARLPVEILADIFTLCIPETRKGHWHMPRTREAPLLVCGVCSRWRKIAISTPVLWTKMSPVLSSSWCEAPLIDLWLQRSSNRPLILELSESPSYCNSNATLENVCTSLISNAHRWMEFRITLNKYLLNYYLLLRDNNSPMIDLVMVKFIVEDGVRENLVDDVFSVFRSFPRLRKLGFNSDCFLTPTRVGMIPWSQLTYIGLCCNMTMEDSLNILSQCHMATEIEMHVNSYTIQSEVPSTPGKISLPHLLSLSLIIDPDAGLILRFLDVPALRCLSIFQVRWTGIPVTADLLGRFLQQSSCQLEKFYISNPNCSSDVILAYLSIPKVAKIQDVGIGSEAVSQRIVDIVKCREDYSAPISYISIRDGIIGWTMPSKPGMRARPWLPLPRFSYTGVILY